jgi:hypothetical protein
MSVDLESNGLLGQSPMVPAEDHLEKNGLLGQPEPDLQDNGLLAMMADDQMLLDIESGMVGLQETNQERLPEQTETVSTPAHFNQMELEPSGLLGLPAGLQQDAAQNISSSAAGPSRLRSYYQTSRNDDSALRAAQALMLPRMYGSTADGKMVSFGRKVRRKWDGVAVSHLYLLMCRDFVSLVDSSLMPTGSAYSAEQ